MNKRAFDAFLSPGITALLLLLLSGCTVSWRMREDPFFLSFFEKTQLIMTEEEIEIYSRIPDKTSKLIFIREFWQIRDPDPGTEENENRIEFEDRIEFATRWFGHWNPRAGRYEGNLERYRGWNTDRGRIYVVLGPPDELHYDGVNVLTRGRWQGEPEGKNFELWYYYKYRMAIPFTKDRSGKWYLQDPDSKLLAALNDAKLNLVDPGYQLDVDRRLKFEAVFKDYLMQVTIPTNRINFVEKAGLLHAQFRLRMTVYLERQKRDVVEKTKTFELSEDEVFEKEELVIAIPYKLAENGQYLFDIMVEDRLSLSFSKYREFIQYSK